ncbi:MAG: transposase [Rhodanobacter sp.]
MRARFYSNELRAEAVRLVVEDRLTAATAGTRLGIRSEVVSVWVRRHRESRGRANDIQQLKILLCNMAVERNELAKIASRFLEKVG